MSDFSHLHWNPLTLVLDLFFQPKNLIPLFFKCSFTCYFSIFLNAISLQQIGHYLLKLIFLNNSQIFPDNYKSITMYNMWRVRIHALLHKSNPSICKTKHNFKLELQLSLATRTLDNCGNYFTIVWSTRSYSHALLQIWGYFFFSVLVGFMMITILG